MNTEKGMSGGPIFYERDDGNCVIIGVHHGKIKGKYYGCLMSEEKRSRIHKSKK